MSDLSVVWGFISQRLLQSNCRPVSGVEAQIDFARWLQQLN